MQIISYKRGQLLFVFNFHPTTCYKTYTTGVEEAGEYQVCHILHCFLEYGQEHKKNK